VSFNKKINRKNTNSFKWDDYQNLFGCSDLMPFWVADMDFATPEPILDAIRERTKHPIFGYEIRSEKYYCAIEDWVRRRHNWSIDREWLTFCPPSTIVGIYGLVNTLTFEGDSIIIPTPNYGPLLNLVKDNQRELIASPMREAQGMFSIDLDDIENKIQKNSKMIIFSNPHNPTGRVFKKSEIDDLSELAKKYKLIVISDEVHCDLVLPGFKHIPFGKVMKHQSVTIFSPNKSFNTASIPQSTFIIPNENIREKFKDYLETTQLNHDASFGSVAMIAAYCHCEEWLDELIIYIHDNHKIVQNYFEKNFPKVKKIYAEATYLAWLDCRALNMSDNEIKKRLVEKGGVGLYGGDYFGMETEGFFRMNIACSREFLIKGLEAIKKALS